MVYIMIQELAIIKAESIGKNEFYPMQLHGNVSIAIMVMNG